MLTFLRICRPLDHEDLFKRLLLRPLTNGDPSGAELLTVRVTPRESFCCSVAVLGSYGPHLPSPN